MVCNSHLFTCGLSCFRGVPQCTVCLNHFPVILWWGVMYSCIPGDDLLSCVQGCSWEDACGGCLRPVQCRAGAAGTEQARRAAAGRARSARNSGRGLWAPASCTLPGCPPRCPCCCKG